MENLANSSRAQHDAAVIVTADEKIESELTRCGIEVVRHEQPLDREVTTHITGKLGLFEFTRSWSYWCMHGPMPLSAALALYATLVGRSDIRPGGDCSCPAPDAVHDGTYIYADWWLDDGREVLNTKTEGELRRYGLSEDYVGRHVYNDDPAAIGARLYVTTYHVDSELGLYKLAEAIRALDPVQLPKTFKHT